MSTAATVTANNLNTPDEVQKYHTFVNLALVLAFVTWIEIIVIYIEPIPWWLVLTVLLVLSVFKFVCVVTWFMHLIYDRVLTTVLFTVGMILGGGTAVALLLLFSPTRAFTLDEMQEQQENYPMPTITRSTSSN